VPGGVRGVGWGLQPRGASIEPDEVVLMALGQLREYSAGQRREFAVPLDLLPMEPISETVLQALRTVGYGRRSPPGSSPR
jgi:O6-methylguanine-DNA--protein-cysteine methyltransferase